MDSQAELNEVILGVDTHLDAHVGVVLNHVGKVLGMLVTPTNQAGHATLLNWVRAFGNVQRAGVEGTGTYGAGLTRVLREQGIEVWGVNRPDRSTRRLQGKSDPTDAESAARAVLSGQANAIPKSQSGVVEAMRIVSVASGRYWSALPIPSAKNDGKQRLSSAFKAAPDSEH